MITVGKMAHAGLVVTAGGLKCLMDPVFIEPFDSGNCVFDPPVRMDTELLCADCDLVIISHSHQDHFSPASLDRLHRDTLVFYPAGDSRIGRALQVLGFANTRGLRVGDRLRIRDLSLIATPSLVPFPEMGVVFEHAGHRVWNLVDSVIDGAVIDAVLIWTGRPDLLLANYQPLVESDLVHNAMGGGFPLDEYAQLVRNVARIKPRHVAPSASGFKFLRSPWLNDRAFPVTEARFGADVHGLDPTIRFVTLPHGGLAGVGDETVVDPDGLPGVERLSDYTEITHDWRPDRGVPALHDGNPLGYSGDEIRTGVADFLDRLFIPSLREHHLDWLQRMQGLDVTWRLEILYPEDAAETRMLHFGDRDLQWSRVDDGRFPGLHTSVAASAVLAVLRGDMNGHAFYFNHIRVNHRLYVIEPEAARTTGDRLDEPLGRVLMQGAAELYLERELARLTGSR